MRALFALVCIIASAVLNEAFHFPNLALLGRSRSSSLSMQGSGLTIDMRGKTVFVAGVADSTGYGWAIAKACAEAGATILLGTWPPVLQLFLMNLERGDFDEAMTLKNGQKMEIKKVSTFIL